MSVISEDPPIDRLINDYTKLWDLGNNSNYVFKKECTSRVQVGFITNREIRLKLKKMKPNGGAGPDGIKRELIIKNKDNYDNIAGLFNILAFHRYYPEQWRINSTTFIPKEGKDLSSSNGWRPGTVGNILGRLYSACIDKRLQKMIKICDPQKGFMEGNGEFENIKALDSIIKQGKKR